MTALEVGRATRQADAGSLGFTLARSSSGYRQCFALLREEQSFGNLCLLVSKKIAAVLGVIAGNLPVKEQLS
jgi:hypothetical protein